MIAANLPLVFLATPSIVVVAKKSLENFKPVILEPTTLGIVEHLHFRPSSGAAGGVQR
jgi:hypothetical protein